MSGRDLENVLNEAHRTCIDSGESMDSRLLQRALSDYVLGKENTGIDLDEETKKRIGFHELGHAVIGFLS